MERLVICRVMALSLFRYWLAASVLASRQVASQAACLLCSSRLSGGMAMKTTRQLEMSTQPMV
jgi:hypothetical protein